MSVEAEAGGIAIPWSAALEIKLLTCGEGLASLRMPWREDLAHDGDDAAPGAVASLVDHACGVAVMSQLSRSVLISTINLKIDHIRPGGQRCCVTAWAHCYWFNQQRAFVRAEVWDHDPNDFFAVAQAVFSINRGIAA